MAWLGGSVLDTLATDLVGWLSKVNLTILQMGNSFFGASTFVQLNDVEVANAMFVCSLA